MQATETGQGAASGAIVQRDPDGASRVVVACDRCPRELTVPRGLSFTEGPQRVRGEYLARWSEVSSATGGGGSQKMLTLCPECTRAFRLFMLGATERNTATVGERWENLICGAV